MVKPKHKIKLLLDSGAFSAWRKNTTISVGEYCDFVHQHKHLLWGHIALDVIPGFQGSIKSTKSIEASAKLTHKNLTEMRHRDLKPLAVYHIGERRYWLEKLIKEGVSHIGLGGLARLPEEIRRPWLDSVFEYLCGSGGFSETKIHGFGVTSTETVHRYPWATIDSVSWRLHSAYGWAIIPDQTNGQYDYRKMPLQTYLSRGNEDSGKTHKAARTHQHIHRMGDTMYKYIKKYIEEEGFDFEESLVNASVRTAVSLRFYVKSHAAFQYSPFKIRSPGLLGHTNTLPGTATSPKKLLWFYGTSPSGGLMRNLKAENIRHILLSYIYFKQAKLRNPLNLAHFVQTGDMIQDEKRKS